MGSPPPIGSKKVVLIFRSVKSIVIAPARTGKDKTKRKVVSRTLQMKRGRRSNEVKWFRILIIVEIKLIDPKIDLAPAKCKEKIAKSTANPLWPIVLAKGGYTVQPVPTPLSIILLNSRNKSEGGSSQNLKLFSRGKAISGELSIKGNNQLPNPPIIIGITIKKIMIKAWAVTRVL